MIINSILILILSVTITYTIIPYLISFGKKYSLIDKPSERKEHKVPLVRIGGLSLLIGFFVPLIINNIFNLKEVSNFENSQLILITLFFSLIYFMIGFIDDLINLSPWTRLSLQFTAAILLWFNGLQINSINLNIFDFSIVLDFPLLFNLIFTTFWIVGIINAINWIDGLDGLASGLTIISSIGLLITSLHFGQNQIALIFIGLIGSCIGFLKFNFYPAKILMGDGGSNFIGFLIGSFSLLSVRNNVNIYSSENINILIPFLIFSIPLFDMLKVIISRLKNKKSPFFPDKSHIHHKLLKIGLNHKNTVLTIFIFNQLIVIFSLIITDIKISPFWLIISGLLTLITLRKLNFWSLFYKNF